MRFRWNDWNIEKIAGHGVTPSEAEWVVQSATRPYPQRHNDGRWLARGRTEFGRLLQIVFLVEESDDIYVIHARPLTNREKRRICRKRT